MCLVYTENVEKLYTINEYYMNIQFIILEYYVKLYAIVQKCGGKANLFSWL